MSKSVKRFRKYNEDYEDHYNDNYDQRQHLKEKRLQAALRSKAKASLLDLIDDEEF
jgi:hypothetical protein